MRLDFGNGIWGDTTGAGGSGIVAHSGARLPEEYENGLSENGVVDGGNVSSSRTPMRHMRFRIIHDHLWTPAEIARAFTPGVERTISSELGSMPYYVEAPPTFPDREAAAAREFAIAIVSELAWPEGDTLVAEIEGMWGAVTVLASQSGEDKSYTVMDLTSYGQTFPLASGDRLTEYAAKTTDDVAEALVAIYAASAGKPTGSPLAIAAGVLGAAGRISAAFDFVAPAAGDYACRVYNANAPGSFTLRANSAGGYASGNAFSGSALGFSAIAAEDMWFEVKGRQFIGGEPSVTFDADTDVPCAPVITCVIGSSSDDLVLEGNGWTTRVVGPFVADDVVEIDARSFTVKVNGVSALSAFDRTGDWPLVEPSSNTISVTPSSATTVAWKPRRMGLL